MNVYEMVTDRIIAELKNGIIPWQKPWSGAGNGAFNRKSGKTYSLLNQLMLQHDGEYATFKQWQEIGGRVRKGEKAEIVVYWNLRKVETDEVDEDGNPKQRTVPILRYYNVFHISQVDGVEPLASGDCHEHEPIEAGEKLLHSYVDESGVNFEEALSDRAYYAPKTDSVVVPEKSQFENIEEFYSTAFHELVHSTGHESRLDRFNGTKVAAFGSGEYSKEELVAEIGAASIINRLGIETAKSFRNSTAYVQSWLQVLKNDSRFIVSAASKAEKAVKLIYGEE